MKYTFDTEKIKTYFRIISKRNTNKEIDELKNEIDNLNKQQSRIENKFNLILTNTKILKSFKQNNLGWSKEDELSLLSIIKTKGITNYSVIGRRYKNVFRRTEKAIVQKAYKLVPQKS